MEVLAKASTLRTEQKRGRERKGTRIANSHPMVSTIPPLKIIDPKKKIDLVSEIISLGINVSKINVCLSR